MSVEVIFGAIVAIITSVVTVYITTGIKARKEREKEERQRLEERKEHYVKVKLEQPEFTQVYSQQHAVGVVTYETEKTDGRFKTFIPDAGRIFIGRKDTCDIFIPDVSLSGQHAIIESDSDGVWLYCIGTNGMAVNGVFVGREKVGLKSGDILQAGEYNLKYVSIS